MKERIRKLAAYYIKLCGTNDPFEIANYINLRVFFVPLGNIAGYYKYMKHNRCIYINSDIENDSFRRIVMAHELGHAILHAKENCCFLKNHTFLSVQKIERQADLFAAELLISDSLLFDYAGYTIEQIASNEGLNKALLELKFL